MLNKNITSIRKLKGMTQQELADQLNVVRQTVSKWERGLSVPDSEMLITISKVLETSVSSLLGETVTEENVYEIDEVMMISKKLELINEQLAREKATKRKWLNWSLIALLTCTVITVIAMFIFNSPYLNWDYNNPELAVVGTIWHGIE